MLPVTLIKLARKILFLAFVLLNLCVIVYCGFVSYLLSVWFINDNVAFGLKNSDWIIIALIRIIKYGFLEGALVAAVVFVMNKLLLRFVVRSIIPKLPFYLAVLSFVVILLASVTGGVSFIVKKPYM